MDSLFEILGTVVGVFYLYYEYRASMWVWVCGIIMPALSLMVYLNAGLYADFGINVYYLLAAVYGWWAWQRKQKNSVAGADNASATLITRTPFRAWPLLLAASGVWFVVIGWVLVRWTDSTVPWWDSLTTSLSIVGMYMLARKWVEQWLVWIVVDAVCCALYIYKGIYFYSALYGAYTIIAVFGYREWRKKSLSTKL